ncbi:hypothetical protein PLICRDRAFT_105361 [Plicaturopsis crispa FD-325 SS-3]|nr:hypothetical protein PLICRDRAFT_105361 [Plicaturopsis crispa FD-325 SS-3]
MSTTAASTTPTISVKVEFSGGLELLFGNTRSHSIVVPGRVSIKNTTTSVRDSEKKIDENATKPADVAYLIAHLRDHLLQEREELFVEDGSVRPGILVLINDTDWELEGESAYVLQEGDEIVFISTLHGG